MSGSEDPGGPAKLGLAIRLGIVFDLDGTLIDSRLDIAAATNHALATHGLRELPASEIASYVGDGARPLLARAARLDGDAAELEPLLESFLAYYEAHPTDHSTLLPGAHEALLAVRDLPLALCTNKPRRVTDAVLSRLRLPAKFSVIIAGGDLPRAKPDPLPLQLIAERLSLKTPELVMVGDGPQDILCAKAVGARSIGVAGALEARELLARACPDVLLASLADLPALVALWLSAPALSV
jgi:2-phosphoglycolate phosphatase